MEQPTQLNYHLTEEDLAKLPTGPIEIFLLSLPIADLLRFDREIKTTSILRTNFDDPRFWIKRMISDGFLLPEDALEFAEKWHKKNQTAAQFLRSFYTGYWKSVV